MLLPETILEWLRILAPLIFSLILAVKISSHRLKKASKPLRFVLVFLALAFTSLVFVTFTFGFANEFINQCVNVFNGKSYTATVIGSRLHSAKVSPPRYDPIVRFKTEGGDVIEIAVDVASRGEPENGTQMRILYIPGRTAQSSEAGAWILRIIGGVFVLIVGAISGVILYKATRYAFGVKTDERGLTGTAFNRGRRVGGRRREKK